jgi:hypothetical protein
MRQTPRAAFEFVIDKQLLVDDASPLAGIIRVRSFDRIDQIRIRTERCAYCCSFVDHRSTFVRVFVARLQRRATSTTRSLRSRRVCSPKLVHRRSTDTKVMFASKRRILFVRLSSYSIDRSIDRSSTTKRRWRARARRATPTTARAPPVRTNGTDCMSGSGRVRVRGRV